MKTSGGGALHQRQRRDRLVGDGIGIGSANLGGLQDFHISGAYFFVFCSLNKIRKSLYLRLYFLPKETKLHPMSRTSAEAMYRIDKAKRNGATTLDLGGFGLTTIPSELDNLAHLQELNLSYNNISEIKGLDNLSNLQQLYLDNNQISEIKGLDMLSNLQRLDLYSNKNSEIMVLDNLGSLQELNLYDNQISEIKGLDNLSNLQQLYLDNNQISEIKGLDMLSNLQRLDLYSNKISEIKGLDMLSNLQELNLYDNKISEIKGLDNLSNLQELNLYDNKISEIKGLDNLSNVQILDLYNNQISKIKDLDNLSNLQILNLSANQISEIKGLDNLSNLQRLELRNNQITAIEPFLLFLQRENRPLKIVFSNHTFIINNQSINLYDNPLQTPPLAIAQEGTAAILRYFEELKKGTKPLMEAKVLIVGQGEAGKTSLKRKLMDINAELPEGKDTTRTIEIDRKPYPYQKETLTIHYWDFGAQNIQHYAHQFFLTENSLYILLSNDREQNPNFQYWLNIIALLGKNSKVLIVQNQKQGHCAPIRNAAAIRGRFGNVLSPFYALDISKVADEGKDRKEYENIERAIVQQALAIPLVTRSYAASFVDIRKKLEDLPASMQYLTWQDYINICKKFGVSEDTAKDYAIAYNAVGVCLYYPDHYLLNNYVFLRPKWIIDALFDLLYSPDVEGGELDSCRLKSIWSAPHYAGMHGNLLYLLEHFELCYRVQDKENLYIVPQRLPIASDSYGFEVQNTTQVVYDYEFMPTGIITRFICRQHLKIKKVWCDAVILEYQQETALVKEVYGDNKIKIEASILHNNILLNIIIDCIDTIHQSFKEKGFNLNVKKLIPCCCEECINSEEPYYFEYDDLMKLVRRGEAKDKERCKKSNTRIVIEDILKRSNLETIKNKGMTRIFISYSKMDLPLISEFQNHLKVLKRDNLVESWFCTELLAGGKWDNDIQEHFNKADMVCFMVSSNFMSNDYIYEYEIKRAFERQNEDPNFKIVPIILDFCRWKTQTYNLSDFTALPYTAKPICDFENRNLAWYIVIECLRISIEEGKYPNSEDYFANHEQFPQDIRAYFKTTKEKVKKIDTEDILKRSNLETIKNKGMKKIFISYAEEDATYLRDFVTAISTLKRQGLVESWFDRESLPGSDWDSDIQNNMRKADIIVILVSGDYFKEEKKYIWEVEIPIIAEKLCSAPNSVIPVVVRPTDSWYDVPIGKNITLGKPNALPAKGKPITDFQKDAAWQEVAAGIRRVIQHKLD
ncbi:MAG: leucine-rich repeat domain-containing protein [Sphingobacteriales bacterium]|nr:leucine-rich repeat domain-containing protein [Sphingobacteriales bacterium]